MTSDNRSVTGRNMKKKLLKKLKLLSESPKIKAHAFVQSLRENMEGFTRCRVKLMVLARHRCAWGIHPTQGYMIW